MDYVSAKTMIRSMLEYFIEQADDDKAQKIMSNLYETITPYITKMEDIFRTEGAAVPAGFTSDDVHKDVPKLYDNEFDIMFVRLAKEISMGMHTLNMGMSYRADIIHLYKELTSITQECYSACTEYLLEKGMIMRSPYVSMPESVQFVKDVNYLGGLKPFAKKRALNTVEVAHEGAKIMIRNGWMEEPPQMEERRELIKA